MKKIFNLAVFFFILAFTLVLSLLSEPSAVCSQFSANPTDTIQSVKRETTVLISNNILRGEITNRQKQDNNSFSGSFPCFIIFNQTNNLFNKVAYNFNGKYFYNLSNIYNKAHNIRAP